MTDGIRVEVDWNKDGQYTDVTTDVWRAASPVTLSYGRDDSTAINAVAAGSGGFTLGNVSRKYSPRNTASPLYGQLRPARPVRITRTYSNITYNLFVGHTDDSPLNPDTDSKTVAVSLLDNLADFRGQTISTPVYKGIRTGQAIGYILDACGWPSSLRDLDPGATLIPWWWEDDADAIEALDKVLRSEGAPALLSIGADGEIIFRDRHHRLTRAASTASQGTWRSKGGIEMARGFSCDEAWRNIINVGTASVEVRTVAIQEAVWTSEATLTLLPGEQRRITVQASDPFIEAVAPVDGIDYTTLSGSVTATLTRTSGLSTTIALTATSAAVITNLQLRARPIVVAYTQQVSVSDVQSIAEYGSRSFPHELPWCNVHDALAVLSTAIAQRAEPRTVIEVRFVCGRNPALVAPILGRNLSDRVTVIEEETSLNGDFYIEYFRHELTGEHDHTVTIGLEAAPTEIDPVLRFDTAGHGFNDGKFGSGADDPNLLFRFDQAGRGFNQGVFAT